MSVEVAIIAALTVLASLAVIGYVVLAFADRYDRASQTRLLASIDDVTAAQVNMAKSIAAEHAELSARVDKLLEARNLRAVAGATGGKT
jgi:hypothetical protein